MTHSIRHSTRQSTVRLDWGSVHVRTGATEVGRPVVLLHQTPRSGDEFAEVIDALGNEHRMLAVDLPGMGRSDRHPGGDEITAYAHGVGDALAALGVDRCVLVGHHTGAAVAATLAAGEPGLVEHLVLSSPPWIDAPARARREQRTGPGLDTITRDIDGSHLHALWAGRADFYPADRPDLLDRFVADALLVDDPGAGHHAVTRWEMPALLELLRALPVTLVDHAADPFAHPHIATWSNALPHAHVAVIDDGMVPLEHTAAAFAHVLAQVLAELGA